MEKEIERAIEDLAKKIKEDTNGNDACALSQAMLNLANVRVTLKLHK